MKKRERIHLAIIIAVSSLSASLLPAQVVVGGGTPDGSAVLEVQSTVGGVLFNRLTTAQRDAIVAPATSLTVYNTDTHCLEVNVGTTSTPEWGQINCRPGTISSLDCAGVTATGTLAAELSASGVTISVPYTGSDGGSYSRKVVASAGVTGLIATLVAGNFAVGAGTLSFTVTGIPGVAGTATFSLNIGGQTCDVNMTVAPPPTCRAKVDAVNYKNFMCYNLGAANTSADPFTPSWEIIGGYWQWGRLAQAVAGPAGPDAGQANDGAVSGWITTYAPDGSWSDASKTANDPCPSGYRIPTKAQWEGVVANNTITSIGTSSDSATNYSSGIKFGTNLFLPNAGKRKYNNGALEVRGSYGYYWSSSASSTNSGLAGYLRFVSTLTTVNFNDRAFGFSVRCIAQ